MLYILFPLDIFSILFVLPLSVLGNDTPFTNTTLTAQTTTLINTTPPATNITTNKTRWSLNKTLHALPPLKYTIPLTLTAAIGLYQTLKPYKSPHKNTTRWADSVVAYMSRTNNHFKPTYIHHLVYLNHRERFMATNVATHHGKNTKGINAYYGQVFKWLKKIAENEKPTSKANSVVLDVLWEMKYAFALNKDAARLYWLLAIQLMQLASNVQEPYLNQHPHFLLDVRMQTLVYDGKLGSIRKKHLKLGYVEINNYMCHDPEGDEEAMANNQPVYEGKSYRCLDSDFVPYGASTTEVQQDLSLSHYFSLLSTLVISPNDPIVWNKYSAPINHALDKLKNTYEAIFLPRHLSTPPAENPPMTEEDIEKLRRPLDPFVAETERIRDAADRYWGYLP